MSTRIGLAVLGMGFLASACGAHGDGSEAATTSADEQAIVGGKQTCAQPAVGLLTPPPHTKDKCTATLVAEDVILTAAHCFDGPLMQEMTLDPDLGTFEANSGCSGAQSYKIIRVRRWSNKNIAWVRTDDDLALAQLDQPVPRSVARPITMATTAPAKGDHLAWYGYGRRDSWFCLAFSKTDGQKSVYDALTYPAHAFRACPQDGGGPVLNSSGELISVLSNNLGWGDPIRHSSELMDQINEWQANEGTGNGGGDGGTGTGSTPPSAGGDGGAAPGPTDPGTAPTPPSDDSTGGDPGADDTSGTDDTTTKPGTRGGIAPTGATSQNSGGCSQSGGTGAGGPGGEAVAALLLLAVLGGRRRKNDAA